MGRLVPPKGREGGPTLCLSPNSWCFVPDFWGSSVCRSSSLIFTIVFTWCSHIVCVSVGIHIFHSSHAGLGLITNDLILNFYHIKMLFPNKIPFTGTED